MAVVTAQISTIDGCPALNRIESFVVPAGTAPELEHQFRSDRGVPFNLTALLGSQSESQADQAYVQLRFKEWISPAGGSNPLVFVNGTVTDHHLGKATFQIDASGIVPGVYMCQFAVLDANKVPVLVNTGTLLVERSLFGLGQANTGPPTVAEMRMAMMDSSRVDNVLLDDVEFKSDQIGFALARPVLFWNEALPPIRRNYDTRNFPYRQQWMEATIGYLSQTAALNYARNDLPTGGARDKAKEKEYNTAAQIRLQAFAEFVRLTRIGINLGMFSGSRLSQYSGL